MIQKVKIEFWFEPSGDRNGPQAKVVLIDSSHLVALMIDYKRGGSTVGSYDIKKIYPDFLED